MSSNTHSSSPADSNAESRYQRVKRILNEAAGDAAPAYQGFHRFWELPLPEFLALQLYGVRMIAPSADEASASASAAPSACGCPSGAGRSMSAPPAAASTCASSGGAGRGAASGLIKGLKGEAPFDGSQFPRLPWGGQPVSAADIQFIEQWIDDGCPADDRHHAKSAGLHASSSKLLARSLGHEAHPLSTQNLNEQRADANAIKVRKNINSLTSDELKRLRDAIAEMHTYDDYYMDERSFNYWARIHASNCQHNWEEFLPWHRAYLYLFEKRLQDIDPSITLPYWDWTSDNQNFPGGAAIDNGEVPVAYQCFIDDEALAALKGKIPDDTWQKLAAIKGKTYNSAPRLFAAAGIQYSTTPADNEPILAALDAANPLWHRLRWPGGSSALFENYPHPADMDRILAINQFFTFGSGPADNQFFGALENVHNLLHLFSGGQNPNFKQGDNPQNRVEPQYGDMFSNSTTTYDPLFWAHHSNVDRLWDAWQKKHPGLDPDNLSSVLPPFEFNVTDTLSAAKLGYEYQLASSVFETEPTTALTRFKSAKAGVSARVLKKHSRAEIRLQGLRHATEGGGILRVFLNEPDADEKTPTKGNDHYVGHFAMFGGPCIGGPGHCAPPSGPRPKGDLRHRHPKTPGNVHLDATATVNRLREKGATDFHIHVVVLGPDGQPKPDILRLDAVSLNFFD
jgi:tyrosinase